MIVPFGNPDKIRAGISRLLDVATFIAIAVAGALLLDAIMLVMWR